jgi:hypothetical protein
MLNLDISDRHKYGPKIKCSLSCEKEFSAILIHNDLLGTFDPGLVSYASVTRYIPETKFADSNRPVTFTELEPEYNDCDEIVLLALIE